MKEKRLIVKKSVFLFVGFLLSFLLLFILPPMIEDTSLRHFLCGVGINPKIVGAISIGYTMLPEILSFLILIILVAYFFKKTICILTLTILFCGNFAIGLFYVPKEINFSNISLIYFLMEILWILPVLLIGYWLGLKLKNKI